ncbi:hypothetical protein ACJ41O_014097 [Fusarium nematophilum]
MDELTDLSDDLFDHLSLSEKAGPTTIDPSKGYLTSLPSEMLHRIVAEKSLERRELKNLGLASSRLLASIRPRFYQSNRFETFRKAIQAADLECIERCEAYNAAPPDIIWRVGRKAEHCWRPHGERHQHHRPIEILTESFDRGDVPGDRVLQVLRWLIDRDADIQDRPYFDAKRPDRFWRPYYYHMPGVFLAILQDPMHRKRVDGACEIIRYLSGRGYTIPTETEPRRFPVLERCGAVFRPVDRRRTAPKAAMEIMLRPALMSHVAGLFINPPYPPPNGLLPYFGPRPNMRTDGSAILYGLYEDLIGPHPWREGYPGEIVGSFAAKVCLLAKYHAVSVEEGLLLNRIVAALGRIQARVEGLGGGVVDVERDAREAWRELCRPVHQGTADGTLEFYFPVLVQPPARHMTYASTVDGILLNCGTILA